MNVIRVLAVLLLVLSPAMVQAQQAPFELGGGVWALRGMDVVEYASSCIEDDTTLCLHGGRFSVQFTLDWGSDKELPGHVIGNPLFDGYGGFWVYGENNPEMVIKILDGCDLNGRYWVYASGLTDRAFLLTVRDEHGNVTYYGKFPAYMVAFQDTGTNFPCASR